MWTALSCDSSLTITLWHINAQSGRRPPHQTRSFRRCLFNVRIKRTFRAAPHRAPKDTPAEIAEKLNKEINTALADPRTKARFAELGLTVLPGSRADFEKLIANDTEKWAKVIKFAGAKPD
jgi:hypothetical protein